MISSVALAHPDYLAYFNEFAGKNPEKILVDSNYDWGQDLKLLAKHFHKMGVQQISLASLDGVERRAYLQAWYGLPKIQALDDCTPRPGWSVVSPTHEKRLLRYRIPGADPPPRICLERPWYDQITPNDRVGPLLLYYTPVPTDAPDREGP